MDEFITRTDCATIIANALPSTGHRITNFTVESLAGQVPGMMAEYYLLTIDVEPAENAAITSHRYFCKRKRMFHKIQEIMCRDQGAYEKEDYIYNVLIRECEKIAKFRATFAPRCYLFVKDTVLVLEDLMRLGYRNEPFPHSYQHCKLVLTALAQYHALTIIYEENRRVSTGENYSAYDEDSIIFKDSLYRRDEAYLGRQWFKNCFAAVGKLVDLSPYREMKQRYLKLEEATYERVKPSTKYRNVICHGDVSLSNVMFQDGADGRPISCKLIDYQALRYNPPAHDVLTYIYLVMNPQIRKQHLHDLLQSYYEDLRAELAKLGIKLEEHISEASFYDSCKFVLPMVVLQTATYATMAPLNDYPHIKADQALYKHYVYGDRSAQCIEVYQKGGEFKETMDEIFRDICEL